MDFRDSLVNLLKTQCLQSPQMGAEVGVHRGRTAKRLLLEFQRLHLYMVDLWAVAKTYTADTITHLTQDEQTGFYLETIEQVKWYGDRYEILRMDSVAAIEKMQPLDFAFIDADHAFAGCHRDMEAYWPIVRPRGLLCGHDYGKSDLPGVTLAVDDFARANELELKIEEGNIWWIRKP